MKTLFPILMILLLSVGALNATVWITDTKRGQLHVLQRPNEPKNGYLCCWHFRLGPEHACADDCPYPRIGIENGSDDIQIKDDGTLTIGGEDSGLKLDEQYVESLTDENGNAKLKYRNTTSEFDNFEFEKNNPKYWAKSEWHLEGNQLYINNNLIAEVAEGIDLTGMVVYTVVKKDFVDSEIQIQVNPNLVSDFTTIDYKVKEEGRYGIEIRSLNGELIQIVSEDILHKGLYRKNINTSNLPAGMYLVTLKSKSSGIRSQTVKFVKRK